MFVALNACLPFDGMVARSLRCFPFGIRLVPLRCGAWGKVRGTCLRRLKGMIPLRIPV